MIITGYGIVLRRLTLEDIEQVRHWRNDPEINRWMIYQDSITSKQQREWFETINNPFNYYFIIEVQQKTIGLIYAKDLDPLTLEGEGGVFIGERNYRETDIPARASILWIRFCFDCLSVKKSRIRVKKENSIALAFNVLLGYQMVMQSDTTYTMELTKDGFYASKGMIGLQKLNFNLSKVSIQGEESSANLPEINSFLIKHGQRS